MKYDAIVSMRSGSWLAFFFSFGARVYKKATPGDEMLGR